MSILTIILIIVGLVAFLILISTIMRIIGTVAKALAVIFLISMIIVTFSNTVPYQIGDYATGIKQEIQKEEASGNISYLSKGKEIMIELAECVHLIKYREKNGKDSKSTKSSTIKKTKVTKKTKQQKGSKTCKKKHDRK